MIPASGAIIGMLRSLKMHGMVHDPRVHLTSLLLDGCGNVGCGQSVSINRW